MCFIHCLHINPYEEKATIRADPLSMFTEQALCNASDFSLLLGRYAYPVRSIA